MALFNEETFHVLADNGFVLAVVDSKQNAIHLATEHCKDQRLTGAAARADVWTFEDSPAKGTDASLVEGNWVAAVLVTWTDQTPTVHVEE